MRGAQAVAKEIAVFGQHAWFAEAALINSGVGVVIAPHGRLARALTVTIDGGQITGYELIAGPARLSRLRLGVLPG